MKNNALKIKCKKKKSKKEEKKSNLIHNIGNITGFFFFMMIRPLSQEMIGLKVFEITCQQNMKASLFSLLVLITILTKMYPSNNVDKK